MLTGIKSLLSSEKAIACGLLVIAATVLTALDKMTIDQWLEYTKWLAVIYVSGKTVQGGITALADAKVKSAEHEAKGAGPVLDMLKQMFEHMQADAETASTPSAVGVVVTPPEPPTTGTSGGAS